jgi:hypothetical protein
VSQITHALSHSRPVAVVKHHYPTNGQQARDIEGVHQDHVENLGGIDIRKIEPLTEKARQHNLRIFLEVLNRIPGSADVQYSDALVDASLIRIDGCYGTPACFGNRDGRDTVSESDLQGICGAYLAGYPLKENTLFARRIDDEWESISIRPLNDSGLENAFQVRVHRGKSNADPL